MKASMIEANERQTAFFSSLTLSEATIHNYKTALRSTFFTEFISTNYKCKSLFEISDLDTLVKLYTTVNVHPKNIQLHRVCSAVVMKYMRFLNNGKKIVKRKDYNMPRAPRKRRALESNIENPTQ